MKLGTVRVHGQERVACLTNDASGVLLPQDGGDLPAWLRQRVTAVRKLTFKRFRVSKLGIDTVCLRP